MSKPSPVSQKPFAWVDVETTGLDENHHDIIEVTIIRVEPMSVDGWGATEIEKVFSTKIKMARPENAHPKALEVNGYTENLWRYARDPKEVWQAIVDEGLLDDCIIAGQNPRFDAKFINATLKRYGFDTRIDYHLYDTATLALEHLKPYVHSVSLTALCVALAIPVRSAHTSFDDVHRTMLVDKILRRAGWVKRMYWKLVIPRRLKKWNDADRPNVWPPLPVIGAIPSI